MIPLNAIRGSFTSDGTTKLLNIPSEVDYMVVLNQTQMATTQGTGRGVRFEYFRGAADGTGVMFTKEDSGNGLDGEWLTSGGFTPINTSKRTPEAEKTGSTLTKADPPVGTITSHGYSNGDTVRIYSGDELTQLNGMLFTIGSVTTNTFELSYMDTNTSAFTANTEFKARKIPWPEMFFPRRRVITAVTAADPVVVTMAVTHGMSVGEIVRINMPSAFGMPEIDEVLAEISAVNTSNNTISLDLDGSGFTSFAWPAPADFDGLYPEVVPVGDDNDVLTGATDNVSYRGMALGGGADGPGGSNNDEMYWIAWAADTLPE